MREIKLHYTEDLLLQAVRTVCLGRYRGWAGLIGGILCSVWFGFIVINSPWNRQSWIPAALGTFLAWQTFTTARHYLSTRRSTLEALWSGRYEGLKLSYTEEQFTIKSETWGQTLPWKAISIVVRLPDSWIFTYKEPGFTLLPLDCLDAEDRVFISRKMQAARKA